MLFNSLSFLMFFPLTCVIYFLIPTLKWRNLFLLCASYFFYMNWEPLYALLLLSSTLITYFAALGIDYYKNDLKKKKVCLIISIVLNLTILFLFKYYNFAAENITEFLQYSGLSLKMPNFTFLLPVGISFYTFQALGYSIDVYRGNTKVEKNIFTYSLFVSFFPQLVAGPIERSTHLLPQFYKLKYFSYENAMRGIKMMLWGYFLKLVLADRCAMYVDAVFGNLEYHNGGSMFISAIFFTLQIYGDFAGYSLVAIGTAKIMGFDLMENFHRPYFASTITDFWHRWHISLSTWFKDYVYIPLGGNRNGEIRTYCNLMITFLVSGIWHGAEWTFLCWGGIHGFFQCVEKFLGWNKKSLTGYSRFFHWILTFTIVSFAWIFFRASTVSEAFFVIKSIFSNFSFPIVESVVFIGVFFALIVLLFKEMKDEFNWKFKIFNSWLFQHTYIVFMIAYIILFGVLKGGQFIYFQF